MRNNSAMVLVIDSEAESKYGIGRDWNKPPLVKDTCYISSALVSYLNITDFENQNVTLSIDLISMLYTLSGFKGSEEDFLFSLLAASQSNILEGLENRFGFEFGNQIDDITKRRILHSLKNALTIRRSFKIASEIESSNGKYPSSLGSVVVLEKNTVNDHINDLIDKFYRFNISSLPDILPDMNNLSINHEATFTSMNNASESIASFLTKHSTFQTIMSNFLNVSNSQFNILDILKDLPEDPPKIDISHYALMAVGSYKNRLQAYSKSNIEMKKDLIQWSNSIAQYLGINYPVQKKTPLVDTISVVYFMRLFLDQILLLIQIFLIALGCYLIYSLLIADIESKVYESGMLRALGIQQYTLVFILIVQSLLFSIPGIIIGLVLSSLIYIPIASLLSSYIVVSIPKNLSGVALAMGIGIGLVVPILALFIPVKRALSKTLRDALDRYHSTVNDTKVTVTKLDSIGISPTQASISILLIIFGFLIYYVIPLAFLYLNMALFFHVFVSIIAGLLAGLSILAMTFHTRVQALILNLIMWGSDRRKLKTVVRKNLHGHSHRNKKTAFLFNMCISFIIFSGSIFKLQQNTLVSNVRLTVGSDIVVQSLDSNFELQLDEDLLREYLLEKQKEVDSGISAFSFVTFSINDLETFRSTRLSNIVNFPDRQTLLYGIEENFLDSVYDQFFIYKEVTDDLKFNKTRSGQLDVARALFHKRDRHTYIPPVIGTSPSKMAENISAIDYNKQVYEDRIPMLISEAVRNPLSLDTKTLVSLKSNINIAKEGRHIQTSPFLRTGSPIATISKMPGFFFSSYEQTSSIAPCIISMNDYQKLISAGQSRSFMKDSQTISKPPKRALFVKMADSATVKQKEIIKNGLRNYITSDRIFLVDMTEVESSTQSSIFILEIFLNVVSAIVIVLCFFVLLISFTSNVTENSWEFGVLRAVGLSAAQAIRVYIYEAFSVIISSFLLGSIIGLFVSITFTLQVSVFTELSMIMGFPTMLFITVMVLAIGVAFLGSYIPASSLKNKRISSVLKGL